MMFQAVIKRDKIRGNVKHREVHGMIFALQYLRGSKILFDTLLEVC